MHLTYRGPINDTGYGIASTSLLIALLRYSNLDITLIPIGGLYIPKDVSPQDTLNIINSTKTEIPDNTKEFIFWFFSDIYNVAPSLLNKPLLAYSTFECDAFDDREHRIIFNIDYRGGIIATASCWGRDILITNTKESLSLSSYKEREIIHHGFLYKEEEALYTCSKDISLEKSKDFWEAILAYKFPNVKAIFSTAGKFEVRKSSKEILEAAIDFSKQVPTILIASWFNPFTPRGVPFSTYNYLGLHLVKDINGISLYKKDQFYLISLPRLNSRENLHTFLKQSIGFISASKGEGWNLPLFEMMHFGIPCIATNNTAQTEYCNKNNSYLIETPEKELAYGQFFEQNTKKYWYKVNKDMILGKIIDLYNDFLRTTSFIKADNAIDTVSKFTWQKSAEQLQRMLPLI